MYFAHRRKDLAYNWMVLLFAVFIVLCGTTHLFNVGALWLPFYRLDGAVKFVTGGVSAATAVLLWRLMPQAIALPSAQELVRSKHELERRVTEQTAELTHTNQAAARARSSFASSPRAYHSCAGWPMQMEIYFGIISDSMTTLA